VFIGEIFGKRLRELRTKNKRTLEEVGEKIGVSRQSVQRWEAFINIPSAQNLFDIAELFNVSIDYLVGRTDISELNSHNHVLLTEDIKTQLDEIAKKEMRSFENLVLYLLNEAIKRYNKQN
jgi:transcriptional regulator with XRE-family HTH domain